MAEAWKRKARRLPILRTAALPAVCVAVALAAGCAPTLAVAAGTAAIAAGGGGGGTVIPPPVAEFGTSSFGDDVVFG